MYVFHCGCSGRHRKLLPLPPRLWRGPAAYPLETLHTHTHPATQLCVSMHVLTYMLTKFEDRIIIYVLVPIEVFIKIRLYLCLFTHLTCINFAVIKCGTGRVDRSMRINSLHDNEVIATLLIRLTHTNDVSHVTSKDHLSPPCSLWQNDIERCACHKQWHHTESGLDLLYPDDYDYFSTEWI